MSYQDRLQPQITFVSPSGLTFNAKWIGNSRSQEKDLGVFKTPGVKGAKIQDLEMGAWVYPLTVHFDGPDNDLDAEKFIVALSEKGTWLVVHPVKGEKTLQLVSVSEDIQPVKSGNITTITTEWLEITGDDAVKSAAQLAGLAKAQNELLQETSGDQLDEVVSLDTADKTSKFKSAIKNTVSSFNTTLKNITDKVADVQKQADSIKRGIDDALGETILDVLSLAGQIQSLVNLPNLVVTDMTTKLDTYSNFTDSILNLSPDSSSQAEVNTAAVQELALTATLGATGVASVTTDLQSRQGVIDSIDANSALFATVTDGLDDIQEIYSGQLLSNSYFSQSKSFSDAAYMVALTTSYLLKSSFDLAIENRITLTEPENPVMVAMREYNGPGENNENIDLFYESNKLAGNEILLLPVGKEIVVYL